MQVFGELPTVEKEENLTPEAEKYSDIGTLQSIFAPTDRDWET